MATGNFAESNCELRAIRIYTGSDHWGAPEDWPTDAGAARFENFMGRGDLEFYFGRVPPSIREQLAEREAFLAAVLQKGFGTSDKPAEEIISAHQSERAYEAPWYVTIVFDQPSALPEQNESDRAWWDWVKAEPTFDKFAEEARQVIDVATAHLGSLIGQGCVDKQIDDKDQIVILREGKKLSTIPKLTGSVSASVVKSAESFPREAIDERFGKLGKSAWSSHQWLSQSIRWFSLSSLAEDPRREFQTMWLALEILVNKGARQYRSEIIETLKVGDADGDAVTELLTKEERSSLAQRFAIVALKLSPDSADDDMAQFRRAKKGRDAVTHGEHDDPDQLPIAETRGLCRKYIDLVLRDVLQ